MARMRNRILQVNLILVITLILAACEPTLTQPDVSCEETDPKVREYTQQIDEAESHNDAREEEIAEISQNIDTFIFLFPIKKPDGSCTLQQEFWTVPCDTAQFRFPMHPRLQCRQIANGIELILPPTSPEYETETSILQTVRTNQPWDDASRTVQNIGEETIGHVPVKIEVQKDPLPEDCDPNDPCAWEWKTAPFHYKIQGKMLYHEAVDFATKQLVCLGNNERCPPPVPYVP